MPTENSERIAQYNREHFLINQIEVYDKLIFAADKISMAFFKPVGEA